MRCKYFGKVRDNNGKIVDSRLYKGLLSITSPKLAKKIYNKTLADEFSDKILPKVTKDQYGEPTLLSMLSLSEELRGSSNMDAVGKALEAELRLNQPRSKEEIDRLTQNFAKANPFKAPLFINPVEHTPTGLPSYWTAYISGQNNLSPATATFIGQIKGILADAGFAIGALNDYEKALGVNGVLDTDAVATGLKEVIRLSNSPEGLKALPEEFAHLVINGLSNESQVERLLSYLKTPGVVEKILGEDYTKYKELYQSEDKLRKEAAAKLLTTSLEEVGINKVEKSILQRLLRFVKNMIGQVLSPISGTTIDKALLAAKGITSDIAEDTLQGKNTKKLSERSTTRDGVYYEIDSKAQRLQELIKRLMKATQIKLKTLEHKGSTTGQNIQKGLLRNLATSYNKGKMLTGIVQYASDVARHSAKMVEMIDNFDDSLPREQRARRISNTQSYTSSYLTALADIKEVLLELREDFNDLKGREVLQLLDPLIQELQYTNIKAQEKGKVAFEQLLIDTFGSEIVVIETGSRAGNYTIADLLDNLQSDIGTAEQWLNGVAESTDLVVKITEMAIRNRTGLAYSDTLNTEKELMAIWKEFRQAGGTNTEFLYERDENGYPTGRYITPYDSQAYKQAYQKAVLEAQKSSDFRVAMENWKKANPLSSFSSQAYKNLSAAERKYYDAYIEIKRKVEEALPKSKRDLYRAVSIRKDFIERLAGTSSPSDLWKQIKDGALDQVMRRVDDGESAFSKGYLNLKGELIKTVPILYTATLDDPRALSMDSVSTLLAYTAMANRYKHLSQLEDLINLGDAVMKKRKVRVIKGGKPVEAVFEKISGIELTEKVWIEGEKSKAYEMWEHVINTSLYGETTSEGDQLQSSGVSAIKTASFINKLSTMMDMGFNLMLGVANVATGIIFQNTEAIAGQYFTANQLRHADGAFFKDLLNIVAEIPSKIKTSKVGLFAELFDIDQESLGAFRDKGVGKGLLSRLFSMKTMLFMLGGGDYWIRSRTAIAMAKNTKLYLDGQEIDLWDALEKVPVVPGDTTRGYKLVLKEGLKDGDGKDFTANDLQKVRNKITRINHKIIGMMNPQDLNKARTTVIGKLAFLYRAWMVSSYNRRMQKSTYDVLMDEESEGYYRTMFRVLKNIAMELRSGSVATITGNLTQTEKYNLKRAVAELGQFALTIIAYNVLSGAWKDEEKNWMQNFILYELRRMQTEVGAVTPTPQFISEINNIVKSPIASTRAMERMSNLFLGLTKPSNYTTEVESGKYKGRTRAFKFFMESPLTLNTNTIIRQFHPEEALKFYDNN